MKQFTEVSELANWDERLALAQLKSCLDKGAKNCGRADSVEGVQRKLIHMYGLSPTEAREQLHYLQRGPNESFFFLGNRVECLCKLAYGDLGPEAEERMALEHFDRAIADTALKQYLLAVRVKSLEDAVKAAEQYALVSQPARQNKTLTTPA